MYRSQLHVRGVLYLAAGFKPRPLGVLVLVIMKLVRTIFMFFKGAASSHLSTLIVRATEIIRRDITHDGCIDTNVGHAEVVLRFLVAEHGVGERALVVLMEEVLRSGHSAAPWLYAGTFSLLHRLVV